MSPKLHITTDTIPTKALTRAIVVLKRANIRPPFSTEKNEKEIGYIPKKNTQTKLLKSTKIWIK